MDFPQEWEKIDEIGEGGQGKVYRVIHRSMGHYSVDISIIHAIKDMASINSGEEHRKREFEQFKKISFCFSKEKNR